MAPSIGPPAPCGAYGYPIDEACAIALETIRRFCGERRGLDEVLLVAFEEEVAEEYRGLGVPAE